MAELTDLQRDALGEIFNIGVGRAASSLSLIVNDTVELSAPSVFLLPPDEAAKRLMGVEFTHFSTVSQHFTGPFDASATLVFPESNALEIVRLMAGPHLSIEELSEYEQEAMCEVGNIILNACMSVLADLFHVQLDGTLPVHRFGDAESISLMEGAEAHVLLVLQVDMMISQQRIQGHILFLLSVSSMARLMEYVEAYLVEQGLV